MKKFVSILLAVSLLFTAVGCSDSEADVASRNLSTAADNFEIMRRVVFFNGITDTYLIEVVGLCSLGNLDSSTQRTVTCRLADDTYVKHFVGLSDNVSYFVEQVDGVDVSTNFYRVIYRPQTILPNIDFG